MGNTTSVSVNEMCHYATSQELDWLRGIASTRLIKDDNVVVIGAGPCVMGLAILEGNPHVNLTVIDNDRTDYAAAHIKAAFPQAKVRFVVTDSSEAGINWQHGPVKLLVIDGDHSFKGVVSDVVAWSWWLENGSHVFIHDVDPTNTEFADSPRYLGSLHAVQRMRKLIFDSMGEVRKVGTAAVFTWRK